jgi:Ca2+-binding EF-hand superfamily protein
MCQVVAIVCLEHRAFAMEEQDSVGKVVDSKVVDIENLILPFATALLEQERKEKETLREIFRGADKDKSGTIEYDEFVEVHV